MIEAHFEDEGVDEGCFGIQHENEFIPIVENILSEVDQQLHTFALKNSHIFHSADSTEGEFHHEQFTLFEVYCSMVESVLQRYLSQTGLSKQSFLTQVQENMRSEKYNKVCVDALFGVEDFENFAQFMSTSLQKQEEALQMVEEMGLSVDAKK